MDLDRLRDIERRHRLPEGLLAAIIEIEEAHQYQLKPKGVIADIEKLIHGYTAQPRE